MKIPRFCNLTDKSQGITFIVVGTLILFNSLNIRFFNSILFVLGLLLIFYGLVGTGLINNLLDVINKHKK